MNGNTGVIYNDVKKSVDDVLDYMGNEISFAMTLALGKPILLRSLGLIPRPLGALSLLTLCKNTSLE